MAYIQFIPVEWSEPLIHSFACNLTELHAFEYKVKEICFFLQ